MSSCHSMNSPDRHFPATLAAVILLASLTGFVFSAQAAAPAPLGSPQFVPSPERPVGWRGDGTGRYPGATPPPATWCIARCCR